VVIPKTRISKFRHVSNVENISLSDVSNPVLRVALLPPIKKVSTFYEQILEVT
jgi:hypothetical protein